MELRPVRPDEYDALGEITLRAYRELFGQPLGSYGSELLDVERRDRDSEVFVAVDDDDDEHRIVGGVTYVPGPGRTMSEFIDPDAAGIRMLAVDPSRQGEGAGLALTNWCIERARSAGRRRVVLHSTPIMTTAHGIYERLGFMRSPQLDEWVEESPDADEPLHLMSFTLEL
jgi:ribosomal protein S18 acetylase RimI-like enzyme